MRPFTAIIAALLFLSLTVGGALAGDKAKKLELTDQELDAVTAAGPAALPERLSTLPSAVNPPLIFGKVQMVFDASIIPSLQSRLQPSDFYKLGVTIQQKMNLTILHP